jgi:hypothetical protein
MRSSCKRFFLHWLNRGEKYTRFVNAVKRVSGLLRKQNSKAELQSYFRNNGHIWQQVSEVVFCFCNNDQLVRNLCAFLTVRAEGDRKSLFSALCADPLSLEKVANHDRGQ